MARGGYGTRYEIDTSSSGDNPFGPAAKANVRFEVSKVALLSDDANKLRINDGEDNIFGPYQRASNGFAVYQEGSWPAGAVNRRLNLNLGSSNLVTGAIWVREHYESSNEE